MPDFKAHRSSVVKEYVHSVLMIDDQAGMGELQVEQKPKVTLVTPPGRRMFGKASILVNPGTATVPSNAEESTDPYEGQTADNHLFNAQEATSSFYENGIVAGLYKPVIEDGVTAKDFAATVKEPALKSDVIIVDWMLKKDSPDYSQELIKSIIKNDLEKGGRLRVIIVYTGEQYLSQKRNDLFDFLNADEFIKVTKSDDYEILSKNLVIAFYNKPRVENQDGRSISSSELPRVSLEGFSKLVDGIVPAFAMKAAGAIRQNSGRIVSRFGKDLDPAYLSHRVLLPEPEDAEVFMLENFVSYMRNILAIGRVDNLTLGDKPIESWIRQNEDLLSRTIINGDDEYKLELEDTIDLSKNGFHNNLHQILESKKSEMARAYKDASKEASLKAISIFDSESISAVDSSMELSILSVFRRTYKDVVDIHEIPYLTQGTIIYSKVKDQFLLCITPKCDTVRIDFSKKFSFAILDEVGGKSFDMVIPLNPFVEQHKKDICEIKKGEVILSIIDDMILHDGKINDKTLNDTLRRLQSANYGDYIHLSTSPKFYTLEHIIFESDEKGRVPSSKICDDLIEFWDKNFNEYIWIGDLHDLNTISRVANLITNLNRTGNDEVEWLRRQYQ